MTAVKAACQSSHWHFNCDEGGRGREAYQSHPVNDFPLIARAEGTSTPPRRRIDAEICILEGLFCSKLGCRRLRRSFLVLESQCRSDEPESTVQHRSTSWPRATFYLRGARRALSLLTQATGSGTRPSILATLSEMP